MEESKPSGTPLVGVLTRNINFPHCGGDMHAGQDQTHIFARIPRLLMSLHNVQQCKTNDISTNANAPVAIIDRQTSRCEAVSEDNSYALLPWIPSHSARQ